MASINVYREALKDWITLQTGTVTYNDSIVKLNEDSKYVPIGINTFDSKNDFLFVFSGGIILPKGLVFNIVDDKKIEKIDGTFKKGSIFYFASMTTVEMDPDIISTKLFQSNFIAKEDASSIIIPDLFFNKDSDSFFVSYKNSILTEHENYEIDNNKIILKDFKIKKNESMTFFIFKKIKKEISEDIIKQRLICGQTNLKGKGTEVVFKNPLNITPVSGFISPMENTQNKLGDTWIRFDDKNIYIGNTGEFNGKVSYSVVFKI